jgi:glutamate-1-semialdehyde 2,1-aminomutase
VQVSVYQQGSELGPPQRPHSVRASSGIPDEIVALTLIAPYNDLASLEDIFAAHEGRIAGMIMEPVMMNAGIIPPEPGYLEGVRELTRRHDALLTFDEVKTGFTVGPGGATRRFGVSPDIVTLAKAIGGGLSCAAVGGTEEVMGHIASGTYDQVGTFNGNPLAMAAARAAVTRVLTAESFADVERLQAGIEEGCRGVIDEFDLPAHPVVIGAKGCVVFSRDPIRNYRQFLLLDDRLSHLHWLIQHNNGVFLPPWGKAEQWLLSVQHTEADADRFVGNFETFARALRG